MQIRPAQPDDAAGIGRVHVETWRSTYAGMLPDSYLVGLSATRHAATWARTLNRPAGSKGESVLVAEDDGHVVGFVSGGAARPCKALKTERTDGEVYTLYVLPDYQGRGLGRELLATGFGHMADAGYTAAVIWVLQPNPSRFFYEAMGGVRIGEREEKFAGAPVLEVAYGWEPLALSVMKKVGG